MLTQTTRIKVKNPDYTQAEGRQKSYSTSGAEVALEMSPLFQEGTLKVNARIAICALS